MMAASKGIPHNIMIRVCPVTGMQRFDIMDNGVAVGEFFDFELCYGIAKEYEATPSNKVSGTEKIAKITLNSVGRRLDGREIREGENTSSNRESKTESSKNKVLVAVN